MTSKLQILEDEIGKRLKASELSGELKQAAGYGKPRDFGVRPHKSNTRSPFAFRVP